MSISISRIAGGLQRVTLSLMFLSAVIGMSDCLSEDLHGMIVMTCALMAIFPLALVMEVYRIKNKHEFYDGFDHAGYLMPGRLAWRAFQQAKSIHRYTFPRSLSQAGAIGALSKLKQGKENQSRAHRPQKKKENNEDSEGDGEPHPTAKHHPTPDITHHYLSAADIASRWSCAKKSIQNQVSLGKLPRPVSLPIGPRWPLTVIEQIERGEWQPEIYKLPPLSKPERGRGRPRIASQATPPNSSQTNKQTRLLP